MSKLAEVAKSVVGINGEYIALDKIIATYPEGILVNGAFVTPQGIPCLTYAEDKDKYFYAVSGDLSKVTSAWLDLCEDVAELNKNLSVENIKIRLYKTKTKKGNTYVKVDILGSVKAVDAETGEIIQSTI